MADIAIEAFGESLAAVALTRRVTTRSVLADAYPKQRRHKTFLTHAFRERSSTTLCGRIPAENLADEYAADATARPSCHACLRRDPRFKLPQNSDGCL